MLGAENTTVSDTEMTALAHDILHSRSETVDPCSVTLSRPTM